MKLLCKRKDVKLELVIDYGIFQVAQWWCIFWPMQKVEEIQFRSQGQKDPMEEEMATHSSILAGTVP